MLKRVSFCTERHSLNAKIRICGRIIEELSIFNRIYHTFDVLFECIHGCAQNETVECIEIIGRNVIHIRNTQYVAHFV